jgi:DNA recombination protein RmuC
VISELGRELHARLVKLSTLLQTLGSRLNSAVRAFNETVGSYEARVLPSARRFGEHGATSAGRELARIDQVTVAARSVQAAELEPPGGDEGEEITVRQLRAAD